MNSKNATSKLKKKYTLKKNVIPCMPHLNALRLLKMLALLTNNKSSLNQRS